MEENQNLSDSEKDISNKEVISSLKKKNWKSYFKEFFMLFLAVFCGFLAENYRESLSAQKIEKEYILSLVEDLENDQINLNNYITDLHIGINHMDTLITLLSDKEQLKLNVNHFYYLGRIAPRLITFSNNSRTFDQLKNSGGFRLIKSKEASDQIMTYYNLIPFIRQLEDVHTQEFESFKEIGAKIFEPSAFRMMESEDGQINQASTLQSLRTDNGELLKELGIYAVYMNGTRRGILPVEEQLRTNGAALIKYLKQKYEIE
ncbi:MAG: hypothetical protein PSV36_14775 [Algoriphagus sp.]|nr:hypothetical protein [Algoriphagus sp.]